MKEAERLFCELERSLKEIYLHEDELLKRTEKCILISEKYLEKLKGHTEISPFQNQEEEISFFKCIKPRFAAKLMYKVYLYNLKYKWPPRSV